MAEASRLFSHMRKTIKDDDVTSASIQLIEFPRIPIYAKCRLQNCNGFISFECKVGTNYDCIVFENLAIFFFPIHRGNFINNFFDMAARQLPSSKSFSLFLSICLSLFLFYFGFKTQFFQ